MHFYLIDPNLESLFKVEGKPSLEQLYQLLDCRLITTAPVFGSNDVFICDDEGLYTDNDICDVRFGKFGDEVFIEQEHHKHFLRGRVIYIGTDTEGESTTPEHTFCYEEVAPAGNYKLVTADERKEVLCRIRGVTFAFEDYHISPFIALRDDEGELKTHSIDEVLEHYRLHEEANDV